MKLGQFSLSLPVKDLAKSKTFYEALGFATLGGDADHGYLIMKNGETIIGLFQGMFEEPMLTFNPGWDSNAQNVDPFDDVREIQKRLMDKGLKIETPISAESDAGPAHFILKDPDGNVIAFDQHR